MVRTEISPELLAAYQATEYWVGAGPGAFCLRVDQHSAPLAQLLRASACEGAAFISACNPYSEPATASDNDAAHERLRQTLKEHATRLLEGAGREPTSRWPEERSFLAVGLGIEAATEVGRCYRQNAILWSGIDAIPRLILLR